MSEFNVIIDNWNQGIEFKKAEAERLRKEREEKAEAENKERRYQAYLALKEEFEK